MQPTHAEITLPTVSLNRVQSSAFSEPLVVYPEVASISNIIEIFYVLLMGKVT